jgi:glycosyltransferase involved in cell wall biosynthesis
MGLDLVWYPDPASHSIDVDTPFFVTVWDLEHRKQPYFPEVSVSGWTWDDRQRHYTRVLPRAAAVFTGTAEGKDEVIRFFGVDPQRVIVNPFSLPMSQLPSEPLPGINQIDDCPYLLYPAQFWPHKNHVNLLHAVRQLHDRHGWHGHLVLTGSDKGNRQHVQEVVERLGLQDSVRFAGFVTSGELRQLYANASALVFPSLFGPDNLPPLEAFSLGCPVVASAIPGAVQQLGEAALLFDPLDPADMAMKIAEVLQQPSTRARLIHRGRTLVANRTPQRHVATVLAAADRFAMLRHNWAANFRHA